MNFMGKLKEYFSKKALGFYFTVAAVVLSLVQLVVYLAGFLPATLASYMHWSVILLSVLAIVSGVTLSAFKVTAPWASAAVTLFEFLSLLMFVRYGYMYFTNQFFGGFSMKLVFEMHFGYLWSIILYILIFIVGIAGIYMKHDKVVKNDKPAEEAVEKVN